MKFLQSRIDRPMKKWKNARYGEYGDVFKMEEVFKNERLEEVVQLSLFDG